MKNPSPVMRKSQRLHEEFVRLGRERRKLMNRLLLILPEIYESGIWQKYATDIYEYAGRYGGIGRSAVEKRLKLEKHLQDKPTLKAAIEKVGVHKVALMATLATSKTEEIFADKALNMSKSALETLSKELRNKEMHTEIGKEIPQISFCQAKAQTMNIELDEEMTFLFLKLKKKFKNSSNKQTMKTILEAADQSTQIPPLHGKKRISRNEITSGERNQSKNVAAKKSITGLPRLVGGDEHEPEPRHIKAAKKRKTLGNGKCQYPNCNKPAEHIHHPNRYAITKNHNNLTALCKDYHEFMHNGLIENETLDVEDWQINVHKDRDQIDEKYKKYRAQALSI